MAGYMEQNLSKEQVCYYRTKIRKEVVLQKLRERGCRVTKQRKLLLDVILEEECTSCKEMYYKACALDSTIGMATVYRMVSLLEDIGAFSRKNMYKISYSMDSEADSMCTIEFEDNTFCRLSVQSWYKVISEGLRICGYAEGKKISSVEVEEYSS